ncbi:MAG TPA: TraR/DksA family transcriptional regulator [Burkholderiales bacterium]|nr:TraR/DksA family transcriptional regulator [Burkholderiales bacterium]
MALTQQQTQSLHTVIEQRRESLLAELRDDVERTRKDRRDDLGGTTGDAGDESVATLIADLDHADVGRDLNELRDLEAARTRLADGSYGTCADCGGEIGYERLKANPAAVRCIACQTRHEKTYGGVSGSSL